MTQQYAYVNDDTLQAAADGSAIGLQATTRGELRIQDFWTHMALNGRAYQIRAGTVATGRAMDSVITDAAAEGCIDAAPGTTIIPADFFVTFAEIATALTVKCRLNAVGVVSSAGTAFTPLPMLQGGAAATSTARVANDGGVTVTVEVVTTTRALFQYNAETLQTPAAANLNGTGPGSIAAVASLSWAPRVPYVGKGAACVYVQLAATNAFPLYYFALNYVEFPTTNL